MYTSIVNKAFFTVLSVGIFFWGLTYLPIYPHGDGPEYIIMTEALFNHISPEIKASDIENYIHKTKYWHERKTFLDVLGLCNDSTSSVLHGSAGFYVAKNHKIYGHHFWFYSLLNVPVRIILELLNADIDKTFIITNILILILGIGIIYFNESNWKNKFFWISLIIVSPHFWYISWPHPDFFAGMSVFLSIWLFYKEKFYASLLCMALPSMHFPPLFIPTLGILFFLMVKKGFTRKNILFCFLASFWVIVPPVFYYLYFGIPNLIAHTGFLDKNQITWNRLHSFFFDLNQGMVIGTPVILFLFIGFTCYNFLNKRINTMFWFPLSVIAMSYFFMQMVNWNHGMAVVNRYVVWTAPFFIVITAVEILKIKQKFAQYFLQISIIISQLIVIYSYIDYKNTFWGNSAKHYPLAMWVLNNYPKFYNPDPMIFLGRNSKAHLSTSDSVVVHTNKKKEITKMMVKEGGAINQLKYRGISEKKLADFSKKTSYKNGWIYLNKDDLQELGYQQKNDTFINYAENIKFQKLYQQLEINLLNNIGWQEEMKKKAQAWNVPLEDVKHQDFLWLIGEEKRNLYNE